MNAFNSAAFISLEFKSDNSDELYPSLVLTVFSDPSILTSSVINETLFKEASRSFNNSLAILHKYVADVDVTPTSPKNTLFLLLISI